MFDTREYSVVYQQNNARTYQNGEDEAYRVAHALSFFHPDIDFRSELRNGTWIVCIYDHGQFRGYVGFPHMQEEDRF
jgi:hypothetical protein